MPAFTFWLSEWFERCACLVFSGGFCLWYRVIPEKVELSWLPVAQRPCHHNPGKEDMTECVKWEKNHTYGLNSLHITLLQICSKERLSISAERGLEHTQESIDQCSPRQDLLGFLDICHFGVFPKFLLQELIQGLRLVGPRTPEHHVLHAEVQAAHVVHGLP